MLSPLIYCLIVVGIVLQRLGELYLSAMHTKKLLSKGAYELGEKNYFHMKFMHSLFFCALIFEGMWHFAPPDKILVIVSLSMLFLGQVLRLHSMHMLGERWTTKVFVVPAHPPVRRGLYRFFPHPNYLGVVLELFALPVLGGLWWTAGIFSLANCFVIRQRIEMEREALLLSERGR